MAFETLRDLYVDQIQDLYSAEGANPRRVAEDDRQSDARDGFATAFSSISSRLDNTPRASSRSPAA